MMEISYKAEIISDNLSDRMCTVILYGITVHDGKETGRFAMDTKVIKDNEYDLYVYPFDKSIDADFLKEWEQQVVGQFKEMTEQFEKDSNNNKKVPDKK